MRMVLLHNDVQSVVIHPCAGYSTLDENMDFRCVYEMYRIGQNFLHLSFISKKSALSSDKCVGKVMFW